MIASPAQLKNKTKILHKGLLVALLPLVLNTTLVLLLNDSLARAAGLLRSCREQTFLVNTVSADLLTVSGILTLGNNAIMNGSYNSFQKIVGGYFIYLESDMARLKARAPQGSGFDAISKEMLGLICAQRAIFPRSQNSLLAADNVVTKLQRTKNWIALSSRETILLDQGLGEARAKFKQAVLLERREERRTLWIVALGLLTNALLTGLLARYFYKNIVDRVGRLVDFSQTLPASKTKNSPGKGPDENLSAAIRQGSDEIAEVGAVMSRTAHALAEAEENRRTLLQMMAHDIRSPLTGASIATEMLTMLVEGDPDISDSEEKPPAMPNQLNSEAKENLDLAIESIHHCLSLVNDLLLLESFEHNSLQPDLYLHNIAELLRRAIHKKQVRAGAAELRLTLQADTDDAGLDVNIDFDLLMTASQKLLENAIARSPRGGLIEVSARAEGKTAKVMVTDSGARLKLDPHKPDALFEKFFQIARTVQNQSEGSEAELGLALVKEIIDAHKGAIGVDSNETSTTFWFSLPVDGEGL